MTQASDHQHGRLATIAPRSAARHARSTYRELVSRGLQAHEAVNLTAFMNGLAVGAVHWTIEELSQLVFLRELRRQGRFGATDGAER